MPEANRASTSSIAADLLNWYDDNARALPWRVAPGARARADPYAVWLSEIMLQQTTVATVAPRFKAFMARFPSVDALAAAPEDDVLGEWAGLGYYARARNLHRCAKAVADRGGFPQTEEELLKLPGVGPYTAAAVAAIAFDRRAIVVDGNVERVGARLFAIDSPIKSARNALRARLDAIWPAARSGDFAQALMDLGAAVCSPASPKCLICPLTEHCVARASGDPARLPVKAPKPERPQRAGVAYALFDAKDRVLLERRPAKGLLGGMLGLPGGDWREGEADAGAPPADGPWRVAGVARHTFTHFRLDLEVRVACAPKGFEPPDELAWFDPATARLPTAMRKALDVALKA